VNPAHTTAAAGGAAAALVTILVWGLSLAHVTVPGEVSAALAMLITALAGYWLHPSVPSDAAKQLDAKLNG
jgi:hypothetical protein